MASSIDLSSVAGLDYATSIDTNLGKITFSFFDRSNGNPLGMITLDINKAKGFIKHLEDVTTYISDAFQENYVTRAAYDSTQKLGFIEFNAPPETRL